MACSTKCALQTERGRGAILEDGPEEDQEEAEARSLMHNEKTDVPTVQEGSAKYGKKMVPGGWPLGTEIIAQNMLTWKQAAAAREEVSSISI